MTAEDILKETEEKGPAALEQALKELSATFSIKIDTVKGACNAYLVDLNKRKRQVNTRIGDLKKQGEDIDAQIEAARSSLVSSAGDTAKFTKAQKHLSDLDSQKAAIESQIGILRAAQIPGDPELYNAVVKAKDDLTAFMGNTQEIQDSVRRYANEQKEKWNHAISSGPIMYPGYSGDPFGVNRAIDEVSRHYLESLKDSQPAVPEIAQPQVTTLTQKQPQKEAKRTPAIYVAHEYDHDEGRTVEKIYDPDTGEFIKSTPWNRQTLLRKIEALEKGTVKESEKPAGSATPKSVQSGNDF